MRVLALAGLVVAALGVGLWFLIVRDDDANVVPDAKAAPAKHDEAAPAPGGAVDMQPHERNLGAEIKKSIEAKRAKDERAAPSLSSDSAPAAGSGSAKPATPEDHMRWAMMKAVHGLEPAILECMDEAKKSGANLDAVSSYSYFMVKKGDEIVPDGAVLEYGPYSESLNNCIMNAGKGMVVETMPEGATRIKVISKLTVEKGEIKNLQMPSYHVLEPN